MSDEFGNVDPDLDGPVTDNGAMTIDGLRLFFIARDDVRDQAQAERDAKRDEDLAQSKSAEAAWKDAHEQRARDRDMAIQNILERDRQENRKEHDDFRIDIHSIKTHGVPRLNMWLIAGALACLVALVALSAGDLSFRVYAFNHAPVVRAMKP